MKTKAARTLVASIALVGLAAFAAPADAAPAQPQYRTGWCC